MRAAIAILILVALTACGTSLIPACDDPKKPCPTDAAPSPPMTADEKACAAACEHLRTLGCPEGHGSLGGEPCMVTCERANALRPLPLACWADAGDVDAARGCGSLRCIR